MSRLDTIGSYKTTVETDDTGTTYVKYHNTVVAMRDVRGRISLESGGWRTRTIMLRMNQALKHWGTGYYVHQVKGEWFVGRFCHGTHERVCEYYDGVTLQ